MIYHNSACIEAAKKLLPVKPKAVLRDFPPNAKPLTLNQQRWRRIQERFKPHIVEAGIIRRIFSAD